ncbi:MAG: deoxyribodipyrimidine photo-lyase [Deltaproteobacteria bacterium]|nr:deoxyribodipyrimidine photo-lyase [Deltaproteobacteria bacterium]
MGVSPTILWFRLDLRLADNPALQAALRRGGPILPVFVWAPEEEGAWAPGGASRWWLHRSLRALAEALEKKGAPLVIRRGPAARALADLARASGAGAVFWNRRYEPDILRRDAALKESLRAQGFEAESCNAALLFEPWELKTRSGDPYKVFTPFWKSCLQRPEPAAPAPEPRRLEGCSGQIASFKLEELALEPKIDWAVGMRAAWSPGEAGARRELRRFLAEAVPTYLEDRDKPGRVATSRLSPHLHFGEIGPRQIWHAVREAAAHDRRAGTQRGSEGYLRELGWREFAYHLLYHFPGTVERPLRPEFEKFPWRRDASALRAWQQGKTGYPLVDAGMRELWTTGWMHNRVRMIVASFLVKDLLIPWQEGARWFWDTLVDADLANNSLGWQWTAGCGADAAPYFRIFNPYTQGEKFDPNAEYVRRWVPELARLPDAWIHRPWEAPPEVLSKSGVVLGKDYPRPIVDHAAARDLALRALETIKKR